MAVLDRHDRLGAVGCHTFAGLVRVVDLDLQQNSGAAQIIW
ncbi:hypothetical protein OIE63_07045 [Streptomyces sp. NBC_01795]|nr:hypothetical protein [Streptomyces sp. NBC_01795]WSA91335.1 hypothetical protein OIE63_07045 [Streptomyces sp. NBC_01795]